MRKERRVMRQIYNCGLRSTSRDLPAEEGDLVPLTTFVFEFKVVNSPSTLILWEIYEEFLVVGVLTRLLDDDLGVIFAEVINDVLVRFAKFEGLVGVETFRVDGDTRCL